MRYNRSTLKLGDWNAICDICGWKYKASQLLKRWDGLMVCRKDWEPRHPQDYLHPIRDRQYVPWTRTDSTVCGEDNINVFACTYTGVSAIPNLAIPGCSIPSALVGADFGPIEFPCPYTPVSLAMPPQCSVTGSSSVPGYMVPGCIIPSAGI